MPATTAAPESNGWKDIDEVTVWECALNTMPLLRELRGRRLQEGWTKVYGDAIRQALSAIRNDDDVARDRALKWFLVLPQLITRSRFGPGHARTVKQVLKRLEAWERHDFRGLLSHWQRDRQRAAAQPSARRPANSDELARVERLIEDGEVGAAVKLMLSDGVADHHSAEIAKQMASKHPARKKAVGPNVGRTCTLEVDLSKVLRTLKVNTGSGVTGCTCGVLRYIGHQYESEAKTTLPALNKFATLWVNGVLPGWYHLVMSTVKLVALIKPSATSSKPQLEQPDNLSWFNSVRHAQALDVAAGEAAEAAEHSAAEAPEARPLGMGDLLRRMIEKALVRDHADAYREFFYPQQVGVGVRGGAALIVTAVRELLRRNPSFVVVRLDLKNAYNEMQRSAMLEAVERNPSLRHLYQLLYSSMYHKSRVYLGDANTRANFDSEEGGQQGSPPVSAAFCAAIHPALVRLDAKLAVAGGASRAIMDDVYAVGEPKAVFAAVADFENEIGALGSDLCRHKCEATSLGSPPDGIITSAGNAGGRGTRAGSVYAEDFKVVDGILCAGVPIGSSSFVASHIAKISASARGCIATVKAKLSASSMHSLWCTTHQCLAGQVDHWLMLTDPDDTKGLAEEHDAAIADAKSGALPPDTVLDGRHVTAEEAKLVRARYELPATLKGLGTRSRRRIAPLAFVTATVGALARFADSASPAGAPVPGFLPNAAWACSIATGKRNGDGPFAEFHREADALATDDPSGQCSRVLRKAWREMQSDAGDPEDGPLAVSADTLSLATSGPLQQKVVTAALELDLASQTDDLARKIASDTGAEGAVRKSRPVGAYTNACRLSGAWTRSIPARGARISNAEFAAAVAMFLGVPVESCVQAAGGLIDGKAGGSLDVFGEELTGCPRPGNPWIRQHDDLVSTIASDMTSAGMVVKSDRRELVGFFTKHLPPQALLEYQHSVFGEHGQGAGGGPPAHAPYDIVLDIQARESGSGGAVLNADVKTIHRGRAERSGWYESAARRGAIGEPEARRAADCRSDEVPKQYLRHAQKVDATYSGHRSDGPLGPVARAVVEAEVVGLTFGAHGEACGNVHAVIKRVADAKAAGQWRAMGCECESDARAAAMWSLRQSWGMAAFRGNGRLLVGSMHLVGGRSEPHVADSVSDGSAAGHEAYAYMLATGRHDAPDLQEWF